MKNKYYREMEKPFGGWSLCGVCFGTAAHNAISHIRVWRWLGPSIMLLGFSLVYTSRAWMTQLLQAPAIIAGQADHEIVPRVYPWGQTPDHATRPTPTPSSSRGPPQCVRVTFV